MNRPSFRLPRLSLLALLLGISTACAGAEADASPAEPEISNWTVSGFGTLGVARSTHSSAEQERTISTPHGITNKWTGRTDSNLGLQVGYRVNEQTDVVVQAASYYREDGSFHPNVTWAFLKHDLTPSLTLRVGRVGTEFLIGADSRLVGYSYTTVRPSPEFYGIIPINFGDGVDARWRTPIGDGLFRLEGFGGVVGENAARYNFKGTKLLKGAVGYDIDSWRFRYINTWTKLAHNLDSITPLTDALTAVGAADVARRLDFKGTHSIYQSLGAIYDDGTWQFQGAVNTVRHESSMLQNSRALTLLASRRVGSLTPYAGYSVVKSSPKSLETGLPDYYFGALNAGVAQALTTAQADNKNLSLGVRWDFWRNMDLKAQVDFIRASKASNLIMINANQDSSTNMTVFSVSLDFIF